MKVLFYGLISLSLSLSLSLISYRNYVTTTFRIEKLTQQLQKFSETYENYLLVKNITIDVH